MIIIIIKIVGVVQFRLAIKPLSMRYTAYTYLIFCFSRVRKGIRNINTDDGKKKSQK